MTGEHVFSNHLESKRCDKIKMSDSIAKKLVLITAICITGICLYYARDDAIWFHMSMFLLLCLTAASLVRFDLLHPYVWFPSVFALYSLSYPLLYKLDIVTNFDYTKSLVMLEWLALSVFLFVIPSRRKIYKFDFQIKKTNNLNWLLLHFLLFVVLISVAMIMTGNYANKRDIYANASLFVQVSFSLAIVLTVLYVFQFTNSYLETQKINYKLLAKVFFVLFIFTIISGERDLLFRFIVLTILMLYAFNKIRTLHLVLMIPVLLLLLPLSHAYKYFFLSGQRSATDISSLNSVIHRVLDGEFISASRNLQILLNHAPETKGLFDGFTIFNDFVRIIFPTDFTNVSWFNDTFFPHVSTTSYGFTLVGQGYINWGYVGIITVFFIAAFFLRFLYLRSSNNIFAFIMYIYSIPLYMYSIRADLANIFSPFIKHLLFSLIVIYCAQFISMNRSYFRGNKNVI